MLGFPLTWLLPTFVLPIPMSTPLSWLPEVSVPGFVLLILFGSGAVFAMRTMNLAFRQQLRYAALVNGCGHLGPLAANRALPDTLQNSPK